MYRQDIRLWPERTVPGGPVDASPRAPWWPAVHSPRGPGKKRAYVCVRCVCLRGATHPLSVSGFCWFLVYENHHCTAFAAIRLHSYVITHIDLNFYATKAHAYASLGRADSSAYKRREDPFQVACANDVSCAIGFPKQG